MTRIDLLTPEGRGYLRALVDRAPLLGERVDMDAPLTEWWKTTIRMLLDLIPTVPPHPKDAPAVARELPSETEHWA